MKRALILILATSPCAFAQEAGNVIFQSAGPVTAVAGGAFARGSVAAVQGAPYSATTTNESIQTLADGNRIVQKNTGTTARDSEGRTRQDASLPAIGNMSAANAPQLVFIHDPVTQTTYTLNLTDKTAQKMSLPPLPPLPPNLPPGAGGMAMSGATTMTMTKVATASAGAMADAQAAGPVFMQRFVTTDEQAEVNTEDLGSQTMEGVVVTGVRTTRTIPAGQIGNEKPITIVTEVWTSPDLKTVVYSKRSDPRMGEQIFQLTNIVRAEPDASLFTIPADFKVVEGPQPIMYRSNR